MATRAMTSQYQYSVSISPEDLGIYKINNDANVTEITPAEFPADLIDDLEPESPVGLPVLCWQSPEGDEFDYSDTLCWVAFDANDIYVVSTYLSRRTRDVMEKECPHFADEMAELIQEVLREAQATK